MKKNQSFSLLTVSALCLFLSACTGGGSGSNSPGNTNNSSAKGLAECPDETTEAVVCGTVYASDGVTPLSNAEVTASSASQSALRGVVSDSQCLTDTSGAFACVFEDAAGETTFTAQKPGFDPVTFTATLTEGEVSSVPDVTLSANNSEKWLVIPGNYDGVQVLLSQLKDCTLNDLTGSPITDLSTFHAENARGSSDCVSKGLTVVDDGDVASTLADATLLVGYDKIFVNCGSSFYAGTANTMTPAGNNLRSYVENGKDLYFSDLESTNVEGLFPGQITFSTASTTTGNITANVPHAGLAGAVSTTVDLAFDLFSWSAMESVASDVTTFIRGDISSMTGVSTDTNAPITVGWQHQAEDANGCVLYTSYHIEGASLGSDQERALKYIVQNVDNSTKCK